MSVGSNLGRHPETPFCHVGKAHLIAACSKVKPGACLVVNLVNAKAVLLSKPDCERLEKRVGIAKKKIASLEIGESALFDEFLSAAQRYQKYFGRNTAESKGALASMANVLKQARIIKAVQNLS